MAEIGFYQLLLTPLERALPRLLERAFRDGHRILVRAGSAERVALLDGVLWTYDEASFLPHACERDGRPEAQPIWLTAKHENPNGASLLVLVDGAEADDLAAFARCADLFDGKDEAALESARMRWRRAREAGHAPLTYWRQTEAGWQRQD